MIPVPMNAMVWLAVGVTDRPDGYPITAVRPDGYVRLLSFTHFPNAATDAAIILRGECRETRVSGAMVLVLLCIFLVAGAGFAEAPTLDIAA